MSRCWRGAGALLVLSVLGGAVAVGPQAATAQTAIAPEDVAAIARGLNCPLCQGYNLQDCPLEVCAQMRELIRQRLEAGDDRATIVAAFVADYGPQVLNAPPARGFFAGVWLVPVIVMLAGFAGLAAFLWRSSRVAVAGVPAAAPARVPDETDPYVAVLERLARTDGDR